MNAQSGDVTDFRSILYPPGSRGPAPDVLPPDYFTDLNLDQIVDAFVAGREQYDLRPFFHTPLESVAGIRYRQDVMRDLEDPVLLAGIHRFARVMQRVREIMEIQAKASCPAQGQRWFLEAAEQYCGGVDALAGLLGESHPASDGMRLLAEFLRSYAGSEAFAGLRDEAGSVAGALGEVRYCLDIEGARIGVGKADPEADYGGEIARIFRKFEQGESGAYAFGPPDEGPLNHVEVAILDRVILLYPQTFQCLEDFCRRHREFPDRTIERFDREVQFYLGVIETLGPMRARGLAFCRPDVLADGKDVDCRGAYDLALAIRLGPKADAIVPNDFGFQGPERILVVSGANQGGKTTFARTVGQLHHLASLGCPVAAHSARVVLFDRLFTHFEREESLRTLHSKLEDDLVRIHAIVRQATARSLVIMNESFSSATWQDALLLGRRVLEQLVRLDLLCVFVTFLDELSGMGPMTVSMVGTVVPDDPARRSFKVVRRQADGLAYAMAIAQKYRLTYQWLLQRIRP